VPEPAAGESVHQRTVTLVRSGNKHDAAYEQMRQALMDDRFKPRHASTDEARAVFKLKSAEKVGAKQ